MSILSVLDSIFVALCVQATFTVLKFIAHRNHQDTMLTEQQKQTALLRSINQRFMGFEVFMGMQKDNTPEG